MCIIVEQVFIQILIAVFIRDMDQKIVIKFLTLLNLKDQFSNLMFFNEISIDTLKEL